MSSMPNTSDPNATPAPAPATDVTPVTPPTDPLADVQAALAGIQQAVSDIQLRVAAITPSAVATEVVRALVDGSLADLPNDMGLPAEQQLGKPLQNYLVWSGRNGTSWALQSPELWLMVATMLDAMNGATDNISKINAAQTALDELRHALRG